MRPIVAAFLVLLLVLAPVAAHGGDGHGEIDDRVYEASGTVSDGLFLEVDFEAQGGDEIQWSVAATQEVSLNIHEHEMGTVMHVQRNETRSEEGTFVVPHNGTFSLMIVGHGGEDADVEVVLEGRFAVVGSQGLEVEAAPAGAPLLVGALALVAFGVFGRRR